MKYQGIIALFSVLVLAACSKKVVPSEEIAGLDYYPMQAGRYAVYDCDSVVYTEIPKDTLHFRYLLKERLADSFVDNEGREAWRLERFVKPFDPLVSYDSMQWRIREVAMVTANVKHIQVQENNNRYTRLIFPVKENASWDGNAQNTAGEQLYTYEYVDKPESIASISFNKVLMVKQIDFPTLISRQYSAEKYASGTGLVFRESIDIKSNTVVPGKPVMDRIERGMVYKQTLINFGHE